MSLTCGFYNAVNHDRRYDARQMSEIFDGIINDGIFMNIGNKMIITSNPGDTDLKDMNVYMGTGKAWFNSSWTKNDSILPLAVPSAEVVLDRIDAVVLEINSNDAVRDNIVKIVTGAPSTNPVKPEMENSEYVHQHPLAYIRVKAGATEIKQEDITNCVGTSECPFITGILETCDTDELIKKWEDGFGRWLEEVKNDISDVNETLKNALWIQIDKVLKAGETSVSFTHSLLKTDARVDFWTEIMGVNPVNHEENDDTLTLYFNSQAKDMKVSIVIYL